MTTHTMHPDSHEHGLADDCPRCAEHAEHPIRSLDQRNLRRIMVLAIDRVMSLDGVGPATETDQVAAGHVLTALERAGKLRMTDPVLFDAYMARWR